MTATPDKPDNGRCACCVCDAVVVCETDELAAEPLCGGCGPIFASSRDYIAEKEAIDPERIAVQTALQADLQFDSLDMVEMSMQLEEQFEIEVSDAAADSIVTVADAVRCVRQFRESPAPENDVAA